MWRCLPLLLASLAVPAQAQGLMRVVVPADAIVVVPPRGQGQPRLAAPPPNFRVQALRDEPMAPPETFAGGNALGLSPLAGLVPLVAGALLGGSLAGSGSGSSSASAGPVRTR